MQHISKGAMPQDQVLKLLHILAKGSQLWLETLLPFLGEAFPDMVLMKDGLPMLMPWHNGNSAAMIKALAAASSQGLALATSHCLGCLSSSNKLLSQQAVLSITVCCSLCCSHMDLSVCLSTDARRNQVELAVAAHSSGANICTTPQCATSMMC
jgi:hypothetical protein